jgi:hypothetical protein
MPIDELPRHEKVFPEALTGLVVRSRTMGWSKEPDVIYETSK